MILCLTPRTPASQAPEESVHFEAGPVSDAALRVFTKRSQDPLEIHVWFRHLYKVQILVPTPILSPQKTRFRCPWLRFKATQRVSSKGKDTPEHFVSSGLCLAKRPRLGGHCCPLFGVLWPYPEVQRELAFLRLVQREPQRQTTKWWVPVYTYPGRDVLFPACLFCQLRKMNA